MLEPAPMVRLSAVILERDGRAALRALGELALVHLIPARAGPETAPREPPRQGGGAAPWAALRQRLDRLQGALGLGGQGAPAAEGSMEELERSLGLAEQRAAGLLARREELRRQGEELSSAAGRLGRFAGLGIPADRVGGGGSLTLLLGDLPGPALDGLGERLGGRALLLAPPGPWPARRPLVVLAAGREREALAAELRRSGFEDLPVPGGGEATLDALAAATAAEAGRAAGELARLEEELRAFSGEVAGKLSGMEARARLEEELGTAEGLLPRTASALLMQGWVPRADAPAVERCLRGAAGGVCALEVVAPEAEEEDRVPVLFRSSRLLRPFERLVAGFGLPRYRELSPAPFLAVSYLVMFGVMFGDVGHGAVLALAGLCGLRVARWRDASVLLLLCGGASALAGLAYGSWFGLDRFRPLALWRDPLQGDPVRFLAVAVGFGVLVISLGLLLHIVDRLRHRDRLAALLDRFGLAGLAFYWAALALLVCGGGRWALSRALPAVLLLAAAAWSIERRREARRRPGQPPARAGGAALAGDLIEIFDTVMVFLANTVSFVRLAAYGMSHAALLLAILMLARAVARPGGLAFALVLAAGNLVAILLEGVIAGVQALRLEYYEFFGKFFSGAGRPFQPFRLELVGGAA